MQKESARLMALEVISAVLEDGAYANIALHGMLETHRPAKLDRAFITELVYGTLRRLNTLDWVLGSFLQKPLAGLPPRIRNILRLGAYQLLYLDRVPDSAACNESVNLARRYGHPGTVKLVNAVLRNVARRKGQLAFPDLAADPGQGIAVKYSHPAWLVRRWLAEFGQAQTEELCRANNEIPPNMIRTNTLKITRPELKRVLATKGVESREGRFAPETLLIDGFRSIGDLQAFNSGFFMVQDESSTLAGHALNPSPGSLVIDACSAPGGKSTHLAQLMGNQGHIISADLYPHKLELIRENAARLGVDIIEPVLIDAAELDRTYGGQADYVLVDAPCSGLGVLRRRPEIKWRQDPARFEELHNLQVKLLAGAAGCLKPGGVMVYSTCTITREENLEVVEEFLRQHQTFELAGLAGNLPAALAEMTGAAAMDRGYLQLLPHVHGTDGFFLARLRRKV